MPSEFPLFVILVFVTVFLLVFAVGVPTFGTRASNVRRTRERMRMLTDSLSQKSLSIIRNRRQENLSTIGRALERLPFMDDIADLLEQTGSTMPAYRLVLITGLVLVPAVIGVHLLTTNPVITLFVALAIGFAPWFWLRFQRAQRLARFEAQLPEALSMISRALRAGMPFTDALNIAGSEMPDPIGAELRTTFADINYGMGVRDGFLNLLTRIPSISLTAVVTAVLVQRETGGNLAEILEKIANVVRGRFKLQRRIRTLSAEGRMSAWVLALVPFALAGFLAVSSPTYLPRMLDDPLGQQLVMFAFGFLIVGIFWIRQVIRIRV